MQNFNCFFKFFFFVYAMLPLRKGQQRLFFNPEVRDLHLSNTICISLTRKKDWAQGPALAGLVLAGLTQEVQTSLYCLR